MKKDAVFRPGISMGLLFLLGGLFPQLLAQSPTTTLSRQERWSLHLAVGNHTVGFPFQNLLAQANPAITDVGIGFQLTKSRTHRLSLRSQSSFIWNDEVGNAWLNGLSLRYVYAHQSGVFAGIELNMGSLRQRYPRETYAYQASSKQFVLTESERIQASYSGFGLLLGYDLHKLDRQGISLFLRSKFYFQVPYFNAQAFPIMPQNMLELGVQLPFQSLFHP